MRENDLRVIKTMESIDNAMMTLLKTKPVNAITVTELARAARISKGTFYLHYLDIYDLFDKLVARHLEDIFSDINLFNLFFDAPDLFFPEFDKKLRSDSDQREMLIHGGGIHLIDNYIDIITKKIYETGRIKKSIKNDLLIQSYFAGLQNITQRHFDDMPAEDNEVLTSELVYILEQMDR